MFTLIRDFAALTSLGRSLFTWPPAPRNTGTILTEEIFLAERLFNASASVGRMRSR